MPQLELRAQLEPDPEVLRRLDGIEGKVDLTLENQETTMIDLAKLKDAVARLQASDTAALSALQTLKDQNTALAAQLATVQTGDPTTQQAIDDVVKQLTQTADTVDAAVAANPSTPNLAASPPTSP